MGPNVTSAWTRNCYIQPAEEEIQEIMARVEGLTNQGEALDEDDWDYEAMQESHGEHFPIMVCQLRDQRRRLYSYVLWERMFVTLFRNFG